MRPLTSWVHVTGEVVATNSFGWVVEAQVEKTAQTGHSSNAGSGSRVLLMNPPAPQKAEFEQLSAKLKVLQTERRSLSDSEAKVRQQQKVASQEQHSLVVHGARSRLLAVQGLEAKRVGDEAARETKALDPQIRTVQNGLAKYPSTLLLAVDCGSTAVDAIAALRARGVDVIVLDHHQVSMPWPAAIALVNPQVEVVRKPTEAAPEAEAAPAAPATGGEGGEKA